MLAQTKKQTNKQNKANYKKYKNIIALTKNIQ